MFHLLSRFPSSKETYNLTFPLFLGFADGLRTLQ